MEKPKYSVFAEILNSRKVTAYKVAKDVGIRESTFSDWKHQRSHPKGDKIVAIARYFNVPMEVFYKKED